MARSKIRHSGTLAQAFGKVLSEWRDEREMSQIDLAVASGYSPRFIGDIERGTKSPTLRTMKDLATLLEVRLGTLIVEAEEMQDMELRERVRPKAPDDAMRKAKPRRKLSKS